MKSLCSVTTGAARVAGPPPQYVGSCSQCGSDLLVRDPEEENFVPCGECGAVESIGGRGMSGAGAGGLLLPRTRATRVAEIAHRIRDQDALGAQVDCAVSPSPRARRGCSPVSGGISRRSPLVGVRVACAWGCLGAFSNVAPRVSNAGHYITVSAQMTWLALSAPTGAGGQSPPGAGMRA